LAAFELGVLGVLGVLAVSFVPARRGLIVFRFPRENAIQPRRAGMKDTAMTPRSPRREKVETGGLHLLSLMSGYPTSSRLKWAAVPIFVFI